MGIQRQDVFYSARAPMIHGAIRKANADVPILFNTEVGISDQAGCSSISPSSKRAVNKRFNEISISFSSIKPAFTSIRQ